jgi:hypothetical protein
MRTSRWLVVLAGLLVAATCVDAQKGRPDGLSSMRRGSFHSSRHHRGRFSLSLGFRNYFAAPLAFGGDYAPLGPFYGVGAPYPNLTVLNVTPPPPPAPIIVIQAPPTIVLEGRAPEGPRQRDMRVPEAPPVPPPTVPLVPTPDRKATPTEPGKDTLPPPREKDRTKEPKRPQRKPADERDLPGPPAPEEDPRDEHARLVRAGQQAFAALEYGRAAQRFRQAIRLSPDEYLPYFLLAQALLAQGTFHDAFDAIRDGMRRRPDWPADRFRPVELYGPHVDEYSALVRSTEKALARHPLDPELLFLRGYVLWFDGRKEEARPFFRQALLRAANRDAIDRFLRALPDEAGL